MYFVVAIVVLLLTLLIGVLLQKVGEFLFGLTNAFSRYSFMLTFVIGVVGAYAVFLHGSTYASIIPNRLQAEALQLSKLRQADASEALQNVIDYKVDKHNQDCYVWADYVAERDILFRFENTPDVSALLVE